MTCDDAQLYLSSDEEGSFEDIGTSFLTRANCPTTTFGVRIVFAYLTYSRSAFLKLQEQIHTAMLKVG
jgi:hypothetical protein